MRNLKPGASARPLSRQSVKKRFAIVRLWHELGIRNAETECVARLKDSAQKLGIEVFEILPDGRFLEDPGRIIVNDDVDFVLHLHYETPKNYDAYSIVALWNPVRFYMEWDYQRTSRNLLSHDDFVSCGSGPADGMVLRRIRNSPFHLDKFPTLYHSLYENLRSPSLGEGKLFYAGINWDVLQGKGSRHGPLLQALDKTGHLKIYGPKIFLGVEVWMGFDSYQGEIPFDGFSMIEEISKAGVSLVFSSAAHKESELMSSRLFESVAAGALIIADENAFVHQHFGDTVLYVDTRRNVQEVAEQILAHLNWAKQHQGKALQKIQQTQEIFSKRFSHKVNLQKLYQELPKRKSVVKKTLLTNTPLIKATGFFLMPQYSEEILARHLESIKRQGDSQMTAILCVEAAIDKALLEKIRKALQKNSAQCTIIKKKFMDRFGSRLKLGAVIHSLITHDLQEETFFFCAPNEELFHDYVEKLTACLAGDPSAKLAASAVLHCTEGPTNKVHDLINHGHVDPAAPSGMARFLFRRNGIPENLATTLPFLDGRPLALFYDPERIVSHCHPTVRIHVKEGEFPPRTWDENFENEILRDFDSKVFTICLNWSYNPHVGPPICPPMEIKEKPKKNVPITAKILREIKRITFQIQKLSNKW